MDNLKKPPTCWIRLGALVSVNLGDGELDGRQVEGAFRPVGEGEAARECPGGDGEAAVHGHVQARVGFHAVGGTLEPSVV